MHQAILRKAAGPHKRFEAWFEGRAYAPHRHDSYALCITMGGVQSFNYRGEERHSLPGELVILHPDESHDGHAGTDEAFGYRGISIDPLEFQAALGQRPLPFIEGGRSSDPRLLALTHVLLGDLDTALDPLAYEDALIALADALVEVSGIAASPELADSEAVGRACAFIRDTLHQPVTMDELEHAAGINRWQLSRDFRMLLGTSPYRYALLRRLDAAQERIIAGEAIANTAYACGFSDQAHLTRHFKSAFGRTPKALQAAARTILQ